MVRTAVPDTLWTLISKYAKATGLSELQAWGMFLHRVVSLIDDGDYDFLGPEFSRVLRGLIANDEIGSLNLPAIDVTKLHLSSKTKSGFVGVYSNGKGFRAVGKSPGFGTGSQSLGTYPSAEQAAWARYLHHKKFKLPYGELEERLTYWRGKYPEMSDADLVGLLDPISFNEKPLGELFAEAGIKPSEEPPQGTRKFEPIGGVDPALFGHD